MFYEYESLNQLVRPASDDEGTTSVSQCLGLRKCASVNDVRCFKENGEERIRRGHGLNDEYQLREERKRFLDLTQKKLKSLAFHASSSQNGLRNKVLLEAALKNILVSRATTTTTTNSSSDISETSCSVNQYSLDLVNFDKELSEKMFVCGDFVDFCLKDEDEMMRGSGFSQDCDNLTMPAKDLVSASVMMTTTTTMAETDPATTPAFGFSPRKRSFSSSSVYSEPDSCWSSSIKRLKTSFHSCVDICDDIPMLAEDIGHGSEELYTNLATFFHRLKTKQ